jgi:hypothetical protein
MGTINKSITHGFLLLLCTEDNAFLGSISTFQSKQLNSSAINILSSNLPVGAGYKHLP